LTAGQSGVLGDAAAAPDAASDTKDLIAILDSLPEREPKRAGLLTVRSTPARASVRLGRSLIGETPLSVSVPAGSHWLSVDLPGYQPVGQAVELAANDSVWREFVLTETSSARKPAQVAVTPDQAAGDRPAPVAVPGPADLLRQAQALRAERNWPQVIATYRELIARYPRSAEGRSSLVSLGNVLLDHAQRPAEALQAFDTYLHWGRQTTLAPEAAFGRALALRALGRRTEEVAELKRFLAEFPNAIQAPRVRRRLEQLNQEEKGK
jgi:tetratricopeptide (TPR) repeat protein